MSKILYSLLVSVFVSAIIARADTFTLTGGASLTGDILKFDGSGLMLRLPGSTYTNVPWSQFSQDSLKQLAQNKKIEPLVEPFIAPSEPARPPKEEIKINAVKRLKYPEKPSVILGLLTSPVGLFVLLMIYGANLFAAYEISVVKARPPGQVIGLSAVLPIIMPIVFLWRPMYVKPAEDQASAEAVMASAGEIDQPQEQMQVVEAANKPEEPAVKKPEPQIFPRGKFTFNKRFVETKFADFIGDPKNDALKFSMEVRSSKEQFAVERIASVMPTEVVFETATGRVTVPLPDIQEIKLNPKVA